MGKLLTRFRLPMMLACAALLGVTNPARATYPEATRPVYLGTGGLALAGGAIDGGTGAAMHGMTFGSLMSYGRQSVTGGFLWKGQDNSPGPFGPGTFMTYDWFLQGPNGNLPPMELVGPGNKRFYFSTQDANGNWIDTRDPEMLGAVLHIPQPPTYGVRNFLVWPEGTTWYFDGYGSKGLQSIYDPHGNMVVYWIYRDASTGLASKILLASGTPDQYRYIYFTAVWPSTLVTQVTVSYDSTGTNNKVWNLTYDGSGRLATITNPLGGVWHYSWTTYVRDDGATVPLLASITDPRGNLVYSNQYDSLGRVNKQTYADGGFITLSYPAGPIGTTGNTTVTDQRGGVRSYGCTWIMGVNGHAEGYHKSSLTDALGRTVQWNYTHANSYLDTQIIDYRGRTVNLTWDYAKGNLLTRSWTTPLGNTATESYVYDPATGVRTSSTDALGRVTSTTVNPCGEITTITDPRGNQSSTTRNSYGDVTAITNALSQTSNMTYGTYGTLLTTTDPLGHTTTRTYDIVGRVASVQDNNGRTTNFTYDLLDHLLTASKTVNGTLFTTTYTCDANGNRTSVTDPKGQVWSASYDSMNRVYQMTSPLSRSITFSYDLTSNPSTVTDRLGNQTIVTYDAENRPLVKTFKKGGVTDSTVTFTYDPTTKLLSSVVDTAAPGSHTWNYSYDTLGRMISVTGPNGTVNYTLNDKLDRRDAFQAGSQGQVTYGFDNEDDITAIIQNGQTANLTYDALNRLSQQSLPTVPNPTTTNWAFDSTGIISSIISKCNGATLDSHTYTRDAMGNITQEVITGSSNSTSTFGYDDLYRLTSATVNGTAYSWVYDAVGNRTSQTAGGVTTAYTYNAGDELTAVNGVSATNDLNSCMTNDGAGGTYSWDARNRLTSMTKGGVTYTFQYGPDNLRMKKTAGAIATTYLLDGSQVVTDTIGGTAYQTLYGPGTDHPLARNSKFFLPNSLGSSTMLTNSTGTPIQSYQYSPFGGLLNSPTDNNPFQFTGRENDGNGLYYYRTRYYNPALGRFISPDSGHDNLNPFVYCGNNPVNATDATGQERRPINWDAQLRPSSPDYETPDWTWKIKWDRSEWSVRGNIPKFPYSDIDPDTGQPYFTRPGINLPYIAPSEPGYVQPPPPRVRIAGGYLPPVEVEEPGTGGGGALGGALGVGFIIVTPNPFDGGKTLLDRLLLDPLYDFYHPKSAEFQDLPPNVQLPGGSQLPVYNGGPLTPAPNTPPPGFAGGPGTDPWGRSPGDPNYNMPP